MRLVFFVLGVLVLGFLAANGARPSADFLVLMGSIVFVYMSLWLVEVWESLPERRPQPKPRGRMPVAHR